MAKEDPQWDLLLDRRQLEKSAGDNVVLPLDAGVPDTFDPTQIQNAADAAEKRATDLWKKATAQYDLGNFEKAVELYIQGKDAVAIARDLKHSLKAVERYIQTFCRVQMVSPRSPFINLFKNIPYWT